MGSGPDSRPVHLQIDDLRPAGSQQLGKVGLHLNGDVLLEDEVVPLFG